MQGRAAKQLWTLLLMFSNQNIANKSFVSSNLIVLCIYLTNKKNFFVKNRKNCDSGPLCR
jgi:hypothetical protein